VSRLLRILPLALLLIAGLALPAHAQSFSLDLDGPTSTQRLVQLFLLFTVLSLAPSILVMVTSFTRIVVVLSFLRTAMGTTTTPPNQVIMSLAMFLTLFIMMPTLEQSWDQGVKPYMDGRIEEQQAFDAAAAPLRTFMLKQVRETDLKLFADAARVPEGTEAVDVPLRVVIPAFMISELRRAFEIGFLIFIPFLVIDMVVASVLMSMGMMMLPPNIISLPFKIIFFVLVDGWFLLAGSLIQSFGT
jgi:flagellar biosynthetic protein FliP